MTLTKTELFEQQQIGREILAYVRESQARAPVSVRSITAFLKVGCGREIDRAAVQDRVTYLVAADYLHSQRVFEAGEYVEYYRITADGMDILDGNKPWRNS